MSSRKIAVEHNGVTYSGELATITATQFGWEDHGILTAHLTCEWPSGGIAVGGFRLDAPGDGERSGTAYGLDHLMMLMRTVGVETWESLKGKHVLVLFAENPGVSTWGSKAVGIAHATDERKVFILEEHAESWREAVPA